MGEVYLAEDTQLERKVAIKFLSEEFSRDEERLRRFIQEAKAASALNHPNILTIHEIGESDGMRFIASEYISGETLREKIDSQTLDLHNTLEIAIEIASALQAAHANKIVHRDIKPDNVMVREDGLVKVLDFGLAKLTERQASDTEAPTRPHVKTRTGTILGTPSYMSPEQTRGKSIDARSDIWSLGVVLYEMLTKRRPFAGETQGDTIAAILRTEAVPPSRLNADVPAELERIIKKTLKKKSDERYQSANDLLIDLKSLKHDLEFATELERTASTNENAVAESRLTNASTADTSRRISTAASLSGETGNRKIALIAGFAILLLAAVGFGYWYYSSQNTKQIESIAVMPFANESGNPDVEYLSDGMTESLINSLSNLPNLSVKARNSVFRYKGTEIDERKVGQDLSVQAVLLGRVIQRGDNITLYLSLVDAKTGTSLWGEQYDRKMQDLAVLQKDITQDVSQKLRTRLSNIDAKNLTKNYTENAEAYQLYLKGRYLWAKRTAESLGKAIEYFSQAIEKDPGFALAYSGLADAYVVPANRMAPRDAMPKAKAAAMRALEIDDTLAEAHTSLGRVLQVYEWNWKEAEKEFKRAIELNPLYAVAHQWYGAYFERIGNSDGSISERKLALELDPLSVSANFELGLAFFFARDHDKAIEQFQKALELDQNFWPALQYLPVAFSQKGMYDEAIAKIQASPENAALSETGAPGYVYAVAGRTKEARTMIEELKRRRGQQQYISPVSLAFTYIGLGEKDEAMAWLEEGYKERAFQMQMLTVDPRWDSLRADPRFVDLVRRIGLPQ